MIQILAKEFNSFLNSLIAYVVIGVFLTSISLLMWVFPETSVLEYGYADMETLFSLGPYVLIFLVPAVTMRSIAEEKKAGTMELLATKPLRDWDIILGKFFAGFLLVLFALIPTVIYYYSIYRLGNPPGNIDTPGIIGSYIGLAFLSGVFCAIGIFASSITRSQIVAFIVAAFLCFFLFSGFSSIATLHIWSANALFIKQLGILDHYESLSKGLIDSRDVIYFLTVAFLILAVTKLVLGSRQSAGEAVGVANWKSRKLGDALWLANAMVFVVFINLLASQYFFRIDLTEEKRYSIKNQTRELLQNLEEDVHVEVFLEGELNAGFRRFRKSIEETLEEFRVYSNNRLRYSFTDPGAAMGQKARAEFMADLSARGIQPTNVIAKKDGQREEKIIFPGAIVSYGGLETGAMLLKGNKAVTSEEVINQSIEGVEFELANAIHKLANVERKRIGFVRGHGELDSLHVAGFTSDLLEFYDVRKVELSSAYSLTRYDALVIAKPTKAFTAHDKFWLDQYIMKGGKVLFLIDKLEASMDSASQQEYLAFPYELNLDDLLFKYGVRINFNLVQDQNAAFTPVITGQVAGRPQVQLLEWPFFPLIHQYHDHPITRNLDAVLTRFVSSIDTVKADGISKTPLLLTSQYSRVVGAPVNVSINELRKNVKPQDFSLSFIPLAYLLEGSFTSLYKNRFLPEGVEKLSFVEEGKPTKLVVIADGDIVRNEINPKTHQPQVLGFDPYTNYTFANKDFLMNAMAYLVDENGLIQTRSKQVKIRPLDKAKISDEKLTWQIINLVIPLMVLIFYGIVRSYFRKRKFASFPG